MVIGLLDVEHRRNRDDTARTGTSKRNLEHAHGRIIHCIRCIRASSYVNLRLRTTFFIGLKELWSRELWFLIGPKGPHTCGNLSPIVSVIMCVITDLILILTLMPMPYYISPNAFSEPKTRRGDVLSAYLLHLRSRLPPCSEATYC
jgi:hypothetical protein